MGWRFGESGGVLSESGGVLSESGGVLSESGLLAGGPGKNHDFPLISAQIRSFPLISCCWARLGVGGVRGGRGRGPLLGKGGVSFGL